MILISQEELRPSPLEKKAAPPKAIPSCPGEVYSFGLIQAFPPGGGGIPSMTDEPTFGSEQGKGDFYENFREKERGMPRDGSKKPGRNVP
jgi:hypothetical protein